MCYQPDRRRGASYPDLIEWKGKYFISATNKQEARIIEVDPSLLAGLWHQAERREVARPGLILDLAAAKLQGGGVPLPRLPSLIADHGGFAIELWLQLRDLHPGQVLLDTRSTARGPGIVISTTNHAALKLELSDGRNRTSWASDPGLLAPGRRHQVIFNVDIAPRLISVVVDGLLCDGGDHAQFGFTRFGDVGLKPTGKEITDINGGPMKIAPGDLAGEIQHVRFYSRYLTTSEMVGNFRAGPP